MSVVFISCDDKLQEEDGYNLLMKSAYKPHKSDYTCTSASFPPSKLPDILRSNILNNFIDV